MFNITMGKGFAIEFPSGWVVSVQWGPGNYGDNYYEPFSSLRGSIREHYTSNEAEVGIWCKGSGEPMQVHGYQSPTQVAAHIADVAARE